MKLRRFLQFISISMVIIGLALVLAALLIGELHVALFLIFPIIYGSGALGSAAIIIIFFGFLILILAFFMSPHGCEDLSKRNLSRTSWISREKHDKFEDFSNDDDKWKEGLEKRAIKTKGAGVVLIGPVPIIFGSEPRMVIVAMLLAIAMIVLVIILAFI
ncbi:MAG: DUF131 domain-containing protein [Methanomassiliicoccales archaeon]